MADAIHQPPYTMAWRQLRGSEDAGVVVDRIPNQGNVSPHDHVFHELVLVERGVADHHAADGTRTLRPGDLILLRPLVWHAYTNARSLTIVNCLIDSTLMQRLMPLLTRTDHASDLFQRRSPRPGESPPLILHASPAQRAALSSALNRMLSEQTQRRPGWQAAATAGLLDVLVEVLRLHGGAADRQPAPASTTTPAATRRVDQAVLDTASHLETHFTQPAALAMLAKRVGLSPGHLSRSFSRQMGMGIVDYLHRMRAEEACRLLRCTEAPIGEIASQVGYDEIAYFSRCFRKQIGQSPRGYRGGDRNHGR